MSTVVFIVVSFLLATVSLSSSITLRDRVLSVSRHSSVLFQVLGNINLVDDDGRSALHHAVLLGDVGLVRFFLEQQANAMLMDNKGNLPLYYAEDLAYADVEKSRRDSPYFIITSLLLQHMKSYSNSKGEATRDRKSWNALHWMVLAGDRAGVEELIDKGFDPTFGRHQTPIDVAFMIRDQEMFNLLLTKGTEAKKLDLQENSLFTIMRTMRMGSTGAGGGSSLERWKTLISWIIEAGFKPPLPHLLLVANIADDDLALLIPFILELGFNVNERSYHRPAGNPRTLLQEAVNWNRPKTLRTLLENNADLGAIDPMSGNIYSLLRYPTISILLDYGFDANTIVDKQGTTILMRAVNLSRVDVVRIIKEGGANTTLVNNKGQTALDLAKIRKQNLPATQTNRKKEMKKIIEILEEDS